MVPVPFEVTSSICSLKRCICSPKIYKIITFIKSKTKESKSRTERELKQKQSQQNIIEQLISCVFFLL